MDTGELNPIFQGTYSSRIELKQRTRELERLLTTAEKTGALLHWLGTPVDDDILWRAWEPMLFNQAHDLMSGVMTDHVYADTGFALGKELAFEYALFPHRHDWRQAGVHREGLAYNHPLIAMTADSHPGILPKRWGFGEVSDCNIAVSAFKLGPDKTSVLRVYETSGQPSHGARIKLAAQVVAAEETNLMEDAGKKSP